MVITLGAHDRSECCYSLQYVDHHDDTRATTNPWTMRHSLVYQKFDTRTLKCSCIMIRPSYHMELSLRSVLEGDIELALKFNSEWTNIHCLFFTSLAENWSQLINYLDMRVTDMVSPTDLEGLETKFLAVQNRDPVTLARKSGPHTMVLRRVKIGHQRFKLLGGSDHQSSKSAESEYKGDKGDHRPD